MKCNMMCAMFLALGLTLLVGFASAQDDPPMTNADVRKLTVAGLPAEVIVAKIEASASDFDTSVEELVALSQAGVDSSVLKAMAGSHGADRPDGSGPVGVGTLRTVATPSANVPTSFRGTPCVRPGIYLEAEGELYDLDVTGTAQKRMGSGVLSGLTYGIVSQKSKAAVRGTRAMLRTTQTPQFLFCFEESQAGLSYQTGGAVNPSEFLLVAFRVSERRKERTFEIGKMNMWTGMQSGTPPKQLREVQYDRLRPGVFRVTPVTTLGAGEYGFYYSGETSLAALGAFTGPSSGGGKIFAFGVDGE